MYMLCAIWHSLHVLRRKTRSATKHTERHASTVVLAATCGLLWVVESCHDCNQTVGLLHLFVREALSRFGCIAVPFDKRGKGCYHEGAEICCCISAVVAKCLRKCEPLRVLYWYALQNGWQHSIHNLVYVLSIWKGCDMKESTSGDVKLSNEEESNFGCISCSCMSPVVLYSWMRTWVGYLSQRITDRRQFEKVVISQFWQVDALSQGIGSLTAVWSSTSRWDNVFF